MQASCNFVHDSHTSVQDEARWGHGLTKAARITASAETISEGRQKVISVIALIAILLSQIPNECGPLLIVHNTLHIFKDLPSARTRQHPLI
jgi:hypothetical protein